MGVLLWCEGVGVGAVGVVGCGWDGGVVFVGGVVG